MNLDKGTKVLEEVAAWQLAETNGAGASCRLVYASKTDVAVQVPLADYGHLEIGPVAKIATKHKAKLFVAVDALVLELQ